MSEPVRLVLVRNRPHEALARAERGETVGIALVQQFRSDSAVLSHRVHAGAHVGKLVGELEMLKFELLSWDSSR